MAEWTDADRMKRFEEMKEQVKRSTARAMRRNARIVPVNQRFGRHLLGTKPSEYLLSTILKPIDLVDPDEPDFESLVISAAEDRSQ